MNIYVYSIADKEGDYTLAQVYCNGKISGFIALALVNGKDCEIEYKYNIDTGEPLEWSEFTNQITLNN